MKSGLDNNSCQVIVVNLTTINFKSIKYFNNNNIYDSLVPANLDVSTELYSLLISSSLSFNILSQIMLTCLKVNKGVSLLFGDRALNRVPEDDGEAAPSIDELEHDSWGGDMLGGVVQPG